MSVPAASPSIKTKTLNFYSPRTRKKHEFRGKYFPWMNGNIFEMKNIKIIREEKHHRKDGKQRRFCWVIKDWRRRAALAMMIFLPQKSAEHAWKHNFTIIAVFYLSGTPIHTILQSIYGKSIWWMRHKLRSQQMVCNPAGWKICKCSFRFFTLDANKFGPN